jgi:tRNA dimethylallyltransferase
MMPERVIFLLGPTASGKTDLALALASRFPVEIVSVDSAQVYRGMDIGTAKPDAATLARFPHHLIDLIDPTEAYSAARFCRDAQAAIGAVHARGAVPLLTGGTMLYARALMQGLSSLPPADPAVREQLESRAREIGWPGMHALLAIHDPATAARLKPNDAQRIQRALEVWQLTGSPLSALQTMADSPVQFPYRSLLLGLMPAERAQLHQRIATRFTQMLSRGLVDELEALRRGFALTPEMPSMRCVGYRQAWEFLDGRSNWRSLTEKGIAATRQLAKRQMTWLRSMPAVEPVDSLAADARAAIEARCGEFLEG